MRHLTKENVRTVEQRRGVMYHTLFYICSKLSSMCQKRNNECTIQLTIYIYIYIYTYIFIPQNHVFPFGKRFCGIYMYSLWNTGTFIDPLHSTHSFLLVGNLDSLSLRPSHRRTATIRRRHLTFCFESSLSYRSQRMALPPHARLART